MRGLHEAQAEVSTWRNLIRLYGKAGQTLQRSDGAHEITQAGRLQLAAWIRLRAEK